MRGTRYLIPALLVGTGLISACAADGAGSAGGASESNDWGDEKAFPEVGGKYAQELTALAGTCAWNATTSAMTITPTANTDQTIIIGARADGVMLVNGSLCASTAITKTVLKTIAVALAAPATDTGNQTVILDFLNGTFAAGTSATAGVKINLGTGSLDAVKLRGTTGADVFTFGAPAVSASVLAGTVGVGLGTDTNRDIEALGAEGFAVSLGAGADSVTGAGGAPIGTGSSALTVALTVNGGAGNDTITGGTGADSVLGGDGDDMIVGGLGNDTIDGEYGNDFISASATADGADTVKCGNELVFVQGAETDTASYALRTTAVTVTVAAVGTGNDGDPTANTGAGEADDIDTSCEIIEGSTAGDILTGDATANVLNGLAGNDTLTGGDGLDTVNGGAGDDKFADLLIGSASKMADTYNGGAGTDTIDYTGRVAALTIAMDGSATSGEATELDTIAIDVENAVGGTLADTITGNASDNILTGAGGNDTLTGGAGDDTFYEGIATNGADKFVGGAGTDTVDYSGRVAAITADIASSGSADADDGLASETDDITNDVENITGSSTAANVLTGDINDNVLTGGAGNDTLTGGAGNDILDGGSGGTDVLACGLDDDIGIGSGTLTKTGCEL